MFADFGELWLVGKTIEEAIENLCNEGSLPDVPDEYYKEDDT